jgi:hypothetical protein
LGGGNMVKLNENVAQEMEKVRKELYVAVDGNLQVLTSKEICKVSTNLDKLIVKYMRTKERNSV